MRVIALRMLMSGVHDRIQKIYAVHSLMQSLRRLRQDEDDRVHFCCPRAQEKTAMTSVPRIRSHTNPPAVHDTVAPSRWSLKSRCGFSAYMQPRHCREEQPTVQVRANLFALYCAQAEVVELRAQVKTLSATNESLRSALQAKEARFTFCAIETASSPCSQIPSACTHYVISDASGRSLQSRFITSNQNLWAFAPQAKAQQVSDELRARLGTCHTELAELREVLYIPHRILRHASLTLHSHV